MSNFFIKESKFFEKENFISNTAKNSETTDNFYREKKTYIYIYILYNVRIDTTHRANVSY